MLPIITPDDFVEEAQRSRKHKEQTGILTTIAALSEIHSSYPGHDEVKKVKRRIAALSTPVLSQTGRFHS